MSKPISENTSKTQNQTTVEDEKVVIAKLVTDLENKLLAVKGDVESHLVSIKGITSTGYDISLVCDLSNIVDILFKYEYAIVTALNMDYPDEMWDEIARCLGLKGIISMDF